MTTEQIHNEAKSAATRIMFWCRMEYVRNELNDDNYITRTIENLMLKVQRETEQAREDGELLAYNCEKRVKKEMIDKACNEFKNFLETRKKTPNYTITDTDIKFWVADFKTMMEVE